MGRFFASLRMTGGVGMAGGRGEAAGCRRMGRFFALLRMTGGGAE
ncbi:MAG: hypothetical protein RR829_05725 [Oscillospiraceae bacterium]